MSRDGGFDPMGDSRIRRERWDRDRFESMRKGRGSIGGGSIAGDSRAGGRDAEHDHYRFQEHDRFPGGRRDIDIREDRDRRGPMVMERERFREDERFDRPARSQPDFLNGPTPSEIANQALTPYRRKSITEKDIDIGIDIRSRREPTRPARPARPGYLRRQSSLDIFDRQRPQYARIERYENTEYRPPANVPIPLPIRERHRSPPRHFQEEDDFEDVRLERRSSEGRDREEFREVEIRKEKIKERRSKSRGAKSTRSSSMSSFEDIQLARATWGKKGKTRLPKRLVKKQVIIDLGYPFDDEGDFYIVTRALEKEHIDELIKISETHQEEKVTYVYEDKASEVAPSVIAPQPVIIPVQPVVAPSHHAPSHYAPSHYAPSVRPPSPSIHEHEHYVEIERSNNVHGFATSFAPENRQLVRRRSERDIRQEIRSLEEERRMLKYERDSERDFEFIETRPAKREVIRVDKDRKVRRDRPNSKIVAAMMATLT